MAKGLGIQINDRKTVIHNMKSDDFVFLKKRIHITDTGKIVMRLTRDNLQEERKRILYLREEYNAGRMPIESIMQSYQSWRGYAKKYNSYHTVRDMDKFFFSVMEWFLILLKMIINLLLRFRGDIVTGKQIGRAHV